MAEAPEGLSCFAMHALALALSLSLSAPSDGAFEKLKALEGSWKTAPADAGGGTANFVTLRVVSGGRALLLTHTGADKTKLATVIVFTLEGADVIATRSDATGTTRLKLTGSTGDAFKFVDGAAGLTLTVTKNELKWDGGKGGAGFTLLREYLDTLK